MKTKLDTKSLFLGMLAGAVVTLTVAATNRSNIPSWEYRVITDETMALPSSPSYAWFHTEALNRHAVDGWELVSSQTLAKAGEKQGQPIELREIILRRAKTK
jgi:hypothetical protein